MKTLFAFVLFVLIVVVVAPVIVPMLSDMLNNMAQVDACLIDATSAACLGH